jgi:uncharacterized membrane protein
MPKKLIAQGFLLALGEGAYIALVALVMRYAATIVPKDPSILGFTTFITIFVLSAAVTGSLIIGKPILLYLDGKKKEAVTLFAFILGWLFVSLLILFLIITLTR